MKIKELKELIKDMPDDADLVFEIYSGCCGDTEQMELVDTDVFKPAKDWSGSLRFTFPQLPGYRSCRQAYNTEQADKEYWADKGKK